MPKFTVFCRESSGEGTMYITSAEAGDAKAAARIALAECASDWGMDRDEIDVIGIAAGDVEILDWNDEPGAGGCDIYGETAA